jgi:transaldolase/glucose-6-phosphate isomerase
MTAKPLKEIGTCGQSLWLDFVSRAIIEDGTLQNMVRNDGFKGVTSNPSIFELAIAKTNDYRPAMERIYAKDAREASEFYEMLVIKDIQDAADILRPVFEETKGSDGFVSLEVAPQLAHDTLKTIEEANRLWHAVNRPNVMIKVPGTEEGFVAVKALIESGINVNITLLFSIEAYKKSAAAYLSGLKARSEQGLPVDSVHSVSSFFLSRIDTKVDELLHKFIAGATDPKMAAKAQSLLGGIAIANAQNAYLAFEEIYKSDLARTLVRRGAHPQRLLWASTGTKNKAYSDVLYIESLVGKNTVNTVPLATIEAIKDHAVIRSQAIREGIFESASKMKSLASFNIDFDKVCAELLSEGLVIFSSAHERLLGELQNKIDQIGNKT